MSRFAVDRTNCPLCQFKHLNNKKYDKIIRDQHQFFIYN